MAKKSFTELENEINNFKIKKFEVYEYQDNNYFLSQICAPTGDRKDYVAMYFPVDKNFKTILPQVFFWRPVEEFMKKFTLVPFN